MAKTTITFELGGQIELKDFEKGIKLFNQLVRALTPRKKDVTWVVQDLQPGSATITLEGKSDVASNVEQVVDSYEGFGDYLSRLDGEMYETSSEYASEQPLVRQKRQVRKVADELIKFLQADNSLKYIRLQTASSDYTIPASHNIPRQNDTLVSIGAITGRVQTLSNRAGLRFNLYDTLYDRAVGCYLMPDQEELMRAVWGKRARVSGSISREVETGRPIAVRQITSVVVLPDFTPSSYKDARGAVPWQHGYKKPEEVIRQLRDA